MLKYKIVPIFLTLGLSVGLHAEIVKNSITCNGKKVVFSTFSSSPAMQEGQMVSVNDKHIKLDEYLTYGNLRCEKYKNEFYAILGANAGNSYEGIWMVNVNNTHSIKEMDYVKARKAQLIH